MDGSVDVDHVSEPRHRSRDDEHESSGAWTFGREVTSSNRRATEALVSVGGPLWAVRDLALGADRWPLSATFVAGWYDDHARLVASAPWTSCGAGGDHAGRNADGAEPVGEHVSLDLRTGLCEWTVCFADGSSRRVRRFAPAHDPKLALQQTDRHLCQQHHANGSCTPATGNPTTGSNPPTSSNPPPDADPPTSSSPSDAHDVIDDLTLPQPTMEVHELSDRLAMAVADVGSCADRNERTALRAAAIGPHGDSARLRAAAALQVGWPALARRSAAEWEQRWRHATTDIPDDPELELGVRFATFRLLELDVPPDWHPRPATSAHSDARDATAQRSDRWHELALGARGLTGTAHRGHVCWDTDVLVVPALSSIAPRAARRVLDYRWHRLAAAVDLAHTDGLPGARFPWESAETGSEVTPRRVVGFDGKPVDVRTADLALHITADIAWAVWNHVNWTGDVDYLAGRGLDVLVKSARFWASRLEHDPDGSAHIRNVIGPDEYHVGVDDDAFTNLMVRHNLEVAARTADRFGAVDRSETARWQALAAAIDDGFDRNTRRYEQFNGFFGLDDVLASGIGEPPLSADALVGRDVIQRIQVIQQPDVLMAYHLVPHLMAADALAANVDYYEPRTAHGSALSPAISAASLLQVGRSGEALRWLRMAANLDLHDITGTTAGGLHLGAIGGVWQTVTTALAGVRAREDDLVFEPCVPPELGRVVHRFGYRGRGVAVDVGGDDAELRSDGPVHVTVGGETRSGTSHHIVLKEGAWQWR